jgi:hypothetical protein
VATRGMDGYHGDWWLPGDGWLPGGWVATRGMGGYQGDGWLPGGWVATRGMGGYQGDGWLPGGWVAKIGGWAAKFVARPIAMAAQNNIIRSKDCRKHLIMNQQEVEHSSLSSPFNFSMMNFSMGVMSSYLCRLRGSESADRWRILRCLPVLPVPAGNPS